MGNVKKDIIFQGYAKMDNIIILGCVSVSGST